MKNNLMNSFKDYLISLKPRDRLITKSHTNKFFEGNNSIVIGWKSYWPFIETLKKEFNQTNNSILDVGTYPGIIPEMIKDFIKPDFEHSIYGLGIGFDDLFYKEMEKFNTRLISADLDPRMTAHLNRVKKIDLPENSIDICILKDVIEHFYDPMYPLREINKVLKKDGLLLLSTDNLSRYESVLNILKGKSCNVPLIEGSMFYDGDWRPHFREYAKHELVQLLTWNGFEVVKHKFFEAEFGFYKVVNNRLIYHDYTSIGFKNNLKKILRSILKYLFPHLRDNHFIIARKVQDDQWINSHAPSLTNDYQIWMKQRMQYY